MNGMGRSLSITLLVLSGLISLTMVAAGIARELGGADGELMLFTGALGMIVTGSAAAVIAALPGQTGEGTGELHRALREVQRALDRMTQQAALSDDARRVLNRTRERELLCRAIEEDIRSHDWAAAQVLTTELASRFGYEQDAERFRLQIELARAEGLDEEITSAVARLDQIIVQRRWDDALAEAGRITAEFPTAQRVRGIADRVTRARRQYKEELERRFLIAAQADRIDEAMELLRELDAYLTEHEAEPFREVARGVIGKARENLGASFKLACQDRQWGIALSVGEQIIAQFPGSRMAAEVSRIIEDIRDRAGASV